MPFIDSMMQRPALLPVALAVTLLAGCATPVTHQGMLAERADIARQHARTVSVSTSGGSETSAVDKPRISDADFTQALVESINKSQVFSRVVAGSEADYVLRVAIISLEQPSFGMSMTVRMEAGWTLKHKDGTKVWQEAIRSSFTASAGDAFAAVTRLRLATEGAARENIKQGLAKISRLNL